MKQEELLAPQGKKGGRGRKADSFRVATKTGAAETKDLARCRK